jgi:hypothetical protein
VLLAQFSVCCGSLAFGRAGRISRCGQKQTDLSHSFCLKKVSIFPVNFFGMQVNQFFSVVLSHDFKLVYGKKECKFSFGASSKYEKNLNFGRNKEI